MRLPGGRQAQPGVATGPSLLEARFDLLEFSDHFFTQCLVHWHLRQDWDLHWAKAGLGQTFGAMAAMAVWLPWP